MSENPSIPRGRLRRLGRLVGMSTRIGSGLAMDGMKKLLGNDEDPRVAAAIKLLGTLGELKGVALKAGQTLSLLSDTLPPEVRSVVAGMFSGAQSLPFEEIAGVLEAELGAPPDTLFAEFAHEPSAAASLGQVHRARLHSGEQVAVKVQYPGVASALEDDLRNAGALVKTLGLGGALLDSKEYFEEVKRELTAELDYRRELRSLEDFRRYLAPWPDLVVPRAYPALCTGRVLVLDWLEGPTLDRYAREGKGTSEERFAVAERVLRAVFGPFFFHRAIHADTHPGNYVVLEGGRLGVLDFGCVKQLPETFWRAHALALKRQLEGGTLDLVELTRSAGFSIGIPDAKARPLFEEMAKIVLAPLEGPYDFGADTTLQQLQAMKTKYLLDLMRVRPPAEAVMYYRAMAGLAHNLRALRAKGDFRPFFHQVIGQLKI